jgi:CO/xanthine dehydrogenase Mo-binding subunit
MTSQAMDVLGKSYVRDDGIEMVAGTTRFVDDLEPPGALYGAVVRAGRSHARILKVDIGRALRAKGVACVITADDVPNNVYGPSVQDQSILCSDKVRYEGDAGGGAARDEKRRLNRRQ